MLNTKAAAAAVGVVGDICLWCVSRDANCTEFVGHQGSVLAISVPTFNQNNSTTHSDDPVQRTRTGTSSSVFFPPEKEHGTGINMSLRNMKGERHKNCFAETLQVYLQQRPEFLIVVFYCTQ